MGCFSPAAQPLQRSTSGIPPPEKVFEAKAYAYEEIIYDQLVAMRKVLMKSTMSRTFHDFSSLDGHIQERAVATVAEDLKLLDRKLEQMRGPSSDHRAAAYAQLLSMMMLDIENAVFNVDRRAVANAVAEQRDALKAIENDRMTWNDTIARKQQTILALQAEQAALEFKNKSLVRAIELLSKELESSNQNLTNSNQRAVEIHMQGIDFKAEVDRRSQRILQSVQSRVGFVPDSIKRSVDSICELLVSYFVLECHIVFRSLLGILCIVLCCFL
jgi:chromosome segregation ATPase